MLNEPTLFTPTATLLITVISSTLSALISLCISSVFYRNLELRKLKFETARKLFGNRHKLSGEKFSEAINEIMIIYSDSKQVREALQAMYDVVKIPESARHPEAPNEAFIRLTKAVCKDIGIKYVNIPDSQFLQFFVVPPQS